LRFLRQDGGKEEHLFGACCTLRPWEDSLLPTITSAGFLASSARSLLHSPFSVCYLPLAPCCLPVIPYYSLHACLYFFWLPSYLSPAVLSAWRVSLSDLSAGLRGDFWQLPLLLPLSAFLSCYPALSPSFLPGDSACLRAFCSVPTPACWNNMLVALPGTGACLPAPCCLRAEHLQCRSVPHCHYSQYKPDVP